MYVDFGGANVNTDKAIVDLIDMLSVKKNCYHKIVSCDYHAHKDETIIIV